MLGKKLIEAAAGNVGGGGGGGTADHYCALGVSASPYLHVYDFSSSTGFGSKYADPTTTPGFDIAGVAWKPDATALVYTTNSGGEVGGYFWSSSGFGTKVTNATHTFFASTYMGGINFNPAGTHVAATGFNFTSYHGQAVFPWSSSTGFGTAVYPSSGAAGRSYDAAWHPSGNYIAVQSNAFGVYTWTGSAFSTFTQPSLVPAAGQYNRARFSPDGNSIVGSNSANSPYIYAWHWNAGFGTQYSNPSTLPGGRVCGIDFTSDSSTIFVSTQNSPRIQAYPFTTGASGGFGTKYSDPSTLPQAIATDVRVTSDDAAVVVGVQTFVQPVVAYPWSGSGFGTKFADPSTAVAAGAFAHDLVAVP